MTFLVYSNLFIAASAAILTYASYCLLGAIPRFSPVLPLIFFATLLVYTLDRLTSTTREDAVEASERHRWVHRHPRLLVALGGAGAVGLGVALWFVPPMVVWALVPLGAVSLGYCLPILRGRSGPYRLKEIPGLKIFAITAVWTGATALLPAVDLFDDPFRPEVALLCLERALFVFAITLPFDIRDVARDRAAGIRTIPHMIGVTGTRRLSLVVLAGFAVCILWHYGTAPEGFAAPLLVSAAITAGLLAGGEETSREMYYVGHLDGMMALQGALVALWTLLT